MLKFTDFVDGKTAGGKSRLRGIYNFLKEMGFEVYNKLGSSDEPHVYFEKPTEFIPDLKNLEFGGIRIYLKGKTVCYRVQNEQDAKPYGLPRMVDIEQLFKDLSEEKDSGAKMAYHILKEFVNFFVVSLKAQESEDESRFGVVVAGDMAAPADASVTNSQDQIHK